MEPRQKKQAIAGRAGFETNKPHQSSSGLLVSLPTVLLHSVCSLLCEGATRLLLVCKTLRKPCNDFLFRAYNDKLSFEFPGLATLSSQQSFSRIELSRLDAALSRFEKQHMDPQEPLSTVCYVGHPPTPYYTDLRNYLPWSRGAIHYFL